MIINHNMNALNAHRNMTSNTTQAGKSMEKLSSGLRINRAGDDAAGLAISEKMRGQIRGLDQATRNSQDGISLIQTAEGALTETQSILQRMRELSVQAANDTNTAEDRGEIQEEINQLTSEVNRISNTTQFNEKNLLDGSLSEKSIKENAQTTTQTTVVAGELNAQIDQKVTNKKDVQLVGDKITIGPKAGTVDTTKLDKDETNTIVIKRDTDGKLKVDINLQDEDGNKLTVNDHKMTAVVGDDGKISYELDADGIQFSITAEEAEKLGAGVTDDNITIDLVGGESTNPDVSGELAVKKQEAKISGITPGTFSGDTGITKIEYSDKLDPSATGLKVEFDNTNDTLKVTITDKDGNLKEDELVAASTGGTFNYDAHGIKFDFDSTKPGDDFVLEFDLTEKVKANNKEVITDPADIEDKSLKFQIGANKDQSLSVSIENMGASALKITGSGDGFSSSSNVTNGTDNEKSEKALDVTSTENANKAIEAFDKAIKTVSSERSKLGAVQNRLEHTINNLGTSSENLTAAESRVRDVDMAKEMSEFSKNNILQQAAQAMLAQAKSQPEGVLQLLR